MNTEIHNAFINALLADACYVEGLRKDDTGEVLTAALSNRLTEKLARYVGDNFKVLTQLTDLGSSGFSVTVFEDKTTSQRYVSLRGTEPGSLSDYITDADAYIGSGLARRQVIAMVNWYLRATTPTSLDAVQIHENRSVDLVTGELGPAKRGAKAAPLTYRALVALKAMQLEQDSERLSLTAGMQASAEILLGTRSVLEYLLSPV